MFRTFHFVPARRALLVATLALAALAAVHGSAGASDIPDICPTWPWPWPDPPPYHELTDDAIRQEFEAIVRYDEFNPAPHWDAGVRLPDVGCVVAR